MSDYDYLSGIALTVALAVALIVHPNADTWLIGIGLFFGLIAVMHAVLWSYARRYKKELERGWDDEVNP